MSGARAAFALAVALCASVLPAAASTEFVLRATGDGTTDVSASIRSALAARRPGEILVVPAGRFVTGPIVIPSGVTLHLSAEATLLGSTDPADYPVQPARWEGREQPAHAPLVSASDARDVAITGPGTIDGRGAGWWAAHEEGRLEAPRPRLVEFTRVSGARIEDVTLLDSPSWTVHPVDSQDIVIRGVTIRAPRDSPNTDGIDPDSSRRIHISDCMIDVGDDAIAIKSGRLPTPGAPSEDITVEDCTLRSGHGAFAIGSEMSGGVRGVVARRLRIEDSWIGIRLKTNRTRGGFIEGVSIEDVEMVDVDRAIVVNPFYGEDDADETAAARVGPGTPRIRDVTLLRIDARGGSRAAKIVGLPEAPIEGLRIESLRCTAQRGLEVRRVDGLSLTGVELSIEKGPAFELVAIDGGEASELVAIGGRRKDAIAELEALRGFTTTGVDRDRWQGRRDAVRTRHTDLDAWPLR